MRTPHGVDKKVVSQSGLASYLGLSNWTVSRAINGHPAVKESTRQRVLEAMKEVGFQPDPLARALRGKGTGLVGISFNELRNNVLLEKLASFEAFLRGHGLRSILVFTDGSLQEEVRAIADFQRLRVDAIILVQSALPALQCEKLLKAEKWVHVDPIVPQNGPTAFVDRNKGVELLIDYLVGLKHRSFGLLGIHKVNEWRWPGLLKAFARHGLSTETHLKSYDVPIDMDPSYEMGVVLAKAVLADDNRPSALLAINDKVALAAAQHLNSAGVSVPDEISITGFDHLEVARHLHPTITTIDHDTQHLMQVAGEILMKKLSEGRSRRSPDHIKVEPRLIIGESTGPKKIQK